MIKNLNNFATTLVIVIIFLTLIEMILPDNKNKKYVVFTCGMVLILSVISPIITLLSGDLNIEEILSNAQDESEMEEIKVYKDYYNEENVKEIYINKLEDDIKDRVAFYECDAVNINLNLDENTYEPTKIKLILKEKSKLIETISINLDSAEKQDISEGKKGEIKSALSKAYQIKCDDIYINEE